ncbi:MAG: HAD family hydrolase [Rikenellaceae bacterium]
MMRLVERAIPEELRTKELINEIRREFIEVYYDNIHTYTTIYPGVSELLTELQKREVTLAVASNKFHDGTRKLVSHYFPNIHFNAVLGQRPDVPLKPNPQIVRDILNICSFTADQTIFIGDSGVDIETAKAAGVESIGVTWGFRTRKELEECGADHIADTTKVILKIING